MGCSDPPTREGEGGQSTPSLFSRGGTLLPSIYADARCIDDVIVSKAIKSIAVEAKAGVVRAADAADSWGITAVDVSSAIEASHIVEDLDSNCGLNGWAGRNPLPLATENQSAREH